MITKAAVLRIAELSRLEIHESELAGYSETLTQVLNNFNEIAQLNTEGIVPLLTPSEISLTLREDVAVKSDGAEKMLASAPERSGNLYKVPPVV